MEVEGLRAKVKQLGGELFYKNQMIEDKTQEVANLMVQVERLKENGRSGWRRGQGSDTVTPQVREGGGGCGFGGGGGGRLFQVLCLCVDVLPCIVGETGEFTSFWSSQVDTYIYIYKYGCQSTCFACDYRLILGACIAAREVCLYLYQSQCGFKLLIIVDEISSCYSKVSVQAMSAK